MASQVLNRPPGLGYFSIEAILASEATVVCVAQQKIPKFGFIVPELESQDIPPDAAFELPLWAAKCLMYPGREWISVVIPYALKKTPEEASDDKLFAADLSTQPGGYYEANRLLACLGTTEAINTSCSAYNAFELRLVVMGADVTKVNIANPALPLRTLDIDTTGKSVPEDLMDPQEKKIYSKSTASAARLANFVEFFNLPLSIYPDRSFKEGGVEGMDGVQEATAASA